MTFFKNARILQKMFDFEDEKKLRFLYDKRMAQEVEIDPLGDEWKVRS